MELFNPFKWKRAVFILLPVLLCLILPSAAQTVPSSGTSTVSGRVLDNEGNPIVGATIVVDGTTLGTTSDINGDYVLNNVPKGHKLIVSFIGYVSYEAEIRDQTIINAVLTQQAVSMEGVTVVAFGKQKKESVISSISTLNTKELRVPSSNLTTALAGRMAGMISYQTSGEPGMDNAEFFIRGITSFGTGKVDPLILIDNVEVTKDDMSRLHPDDIQSFSVLKDATATALYGARGANGVILITTKEGEVGKVKVSFRFENSFSTPTYTLDMADGITYMRMANEATLTRNPTSSPPYSQSQIDYTRRKANPYYYPSVNWIDELTKKVAVNQRVNLNISGGGSVARYYIAASFAQDNGILKNDKRNKYSNAIDLKKYLIRSNININITKSTEAIVRVHGTFDDYTGPSISGTDLYSRAMQTSPSRFPAFYPTPEDGAYANSKHILFGDDRNGGGYFNPYAEMVKGFRQESKTVMMAQFELKQDFGKWVKGLNARLLGNTTRTSAFDLTRTYSPFYYGSFGYDYQLNTYQLELLNPGAGNEYLTYYPGYKTVESSFYAEGSISYDRLFREKHHVSAMLVGILRNTVTGNASTLSASLPQRNLGLSGRFTYDYDTRYFMEFNFGYNGSEKFDKGHRWGFFPSAGIGWLVSNEKFWENSGISNIISMLKIRGTYGLVGNDQIGATRFFYLSNVLLGGGGSYTTGLDMNITKRGVKINNYANPNIGWEIAYKTNIGLELGLFKDRVNIMADIFHERRTNILQERADIPVETGLWAKQMVNFGEAKGHGVDVSVDYNHVINNDLWITGRANFTYARSEYSKYEEPDYSKTPWRSRIGHSVKQRWGYVAERLFIDDADVENSPRQDFGEYGPGDIKYKDINGDKVINELDQVPIGSPTVPEINYGFGLSMGYKNFDFSFFFQGSARSSFWINAAGMSPFYVHKDNITGRTLETGLAQFIADDVWTEQQQNPQAGWPRLSTYLIANNNQISTKFMRNGAFLRLKSAELGYSLPSKVTNKLRLSSVRFYVSGTNLFCFSAFKLWDVEMGGSGLGYPLQRVFNVGVNVKF